MVDHTTIVTRGEGVAIVLSIFLSYLITSPPPRLASSVLCLAALPADVFLSNLYYYYIPLNACFFVRRLSFVVVLVVVSFRLVSWHILFPEAKAWTSLAQSCLIILSLTYRTAHRAQPTKPSRPSPNNAPPPPLPFSSSIPAHSALALPTNALSKLNR